MENIIIKKACKSEIDDIEAIYNESIDWLNNLGIHQWKKGVYPTNEDIYDINIYLAYHSPYINACC